MSKFINMYKEKFLSERYLRIYLNDGELIIDVNDDEQWKNVLKWFDKIQEIKSTEWKWNVLSGEVVVFQ